MRAMETASRLRRFAPGVLLLLAPFACHTGSGGGGDVVHLPAENALGPYSGSVLVGELCFVSGKIGRTGGTFEQEVDTCIDAIEAELARSDLGLADVVDVMALLTDIDRYHEFNRIYGERFPAPYPSRACYEVAALPGGARVEIKVVARRR